MMARIMAVKGGKVAGDPLACGPAWRREEKLGSTGWGLPAKDSDVRVAIAY